MTEAKAKLSYYRVSPRKVRLVVDLVRGKKVDDALDQLKYSTKRAAPAVLRLLESAISNATESLKGESRNDLYIKKITVDEGPTLKRYRPRARGSAYVIRKRTSHIKIALAGKAQKKEKKKEVKPSDAKARAGKKEKKRERQEK